MEGNPTQSTPSHSITLTLPPLLVRWYQKLPKSTWRAALLLFVLGVGIGCGAVALKESLQWYRNRPLPKLPDRNWPDFSFPEYELNAKLSTEWDESLGQLNYRLILLPSDATHSEEFFSQLSQHSMFAQVSINIYDNRHFMVASSAKYLNLFTTILDANGKKHAIVTQGRLFLTREQYAALSRWDLTVSGLPTFNSNSAMGNSAPTETRSRSKNSGLQGDDVITGYSVMESNLATSGGLTFHINNDAETQKAIEWGVDSARVHYECSLTLECTLHRNGTGVVLHAQLRK